MAVGQASAAAFVSTGAPDALDQSSPAPDAAATGVICPFLRGQAESLDMAADQADCHQGLSRMEHLSEDIRAQRKGAEVLEHGYELGSPTLTAGSSKLAAEADFNTYAPALELEILRRQAVKLPGGYEPPLISRYVLYLGT